MNVYIPTYKRGTTTSLLNGPLKDMDPYTLAHTFLVVHPDEEEQYTRSLGHTRFDMVQTLTCYQQGVGNMGLIRQWIGRHAAEHNSPKFLMLDDDIVFYRRKSPDAFNLRYVKPEEFTGVVEIIDHLLNNGYGHVAISPREGNNRLDEPNGYYTENTRYSRAQAFRTADFLACEHGRVQFMEDFDINLQLLRRGIPNAVIYSWAQGQKMTNATGGCSTFRTHAVHDEDVQKLIQYHPEFVRPRLKTNKTGGDFGVRTEVTISWKKAFESSQKVTA